MTKGSGRDGIMMPLEQFRISAFGVGTPAAVKIFLDLVLSKQTVLEREPAPVYGMPRFSRMDWSAPSSPKVP